MATLTSRLIVSLTDRVTGPARGISGALARLHRQGQRTSGALIGGGVGMMGGTVRNMLAIGAGYVGVSKAIGGTVGAAIKFEEAFADVRKVVDGTPAQLSAVRSEIVDMSKRLPVTAEGLASIYAAAGQSGVALQELGKFSEMAAKVSVAWDTSQAETGDALAKIKTQLGFNVDQLGLHADAINHLANNTASAANDLVDFDKRVAAVGKMYGFTDTQTLAFGASMISAGAQSEVAATSFRNMGKALTIGERATKKQREAFSKLGIDAVKTAKSMQKNALETTLDVLDRIQKLPEWQRNSIASALFGDEARGLLPVIADARELRRELAMVGTEANYSGSAFQEYLVRSQTTANALQLIGNKIKAVGIGIGDSWLPTIQQLGLGIGDVLDTLEKRVGVLDQVRFAFQGFMGGIGYGGSGDVRRMVNDIGDLFFGKAFGGSLSDADERMTALARLSNRFRMIGADLKSFADNVAGGNLGAAIGNVGDAIGKMGGTLSVGSALAIAFTGRALLGLASGAAALAFSKTGQIFFMAMAVSALINAVKDAGSLGEFVENLKGLSALEWAGIGAGLLIVAGRAARVVGWFRQLGRLAPTAATVAGGATVAAGAATKGGGASVAGAGAKQGAGWFSRWLTGGGGAKDIVASGRTSTEATLLEKLGLSAGRLGEATGVIGRAASRLLGLPAIAGEITTRALLATPPTDPRLADPSFAPWAYRRAEDRNAGRAQEPQQAAPPQASQPVPFSFGQMFRDLMQPVGAVAAPQVDTTAAKQKVDELNASLTSATTGWPAAAQTGIRAYVDALATGGGQAEAEADRIGSGIKDALSVTGQPQIDTSQLARALEIARQLGAAIRSAGSTSVSLPARQIDGARARGGPVRRGGRYLVGEEGPELLDMGVGGFIHDARSTGAMLRDMAKRAALASAIGAMPLAAAAQTPTMDPIRVIIDTSALDQFAPPSWPQPPAISMQDWPAVPSIKMPPWSQPPAVSMPSWPQPPAIDVPSLPDSAAANTKDQQAASSERRVDIRFEGGAIVIHAAPGQSSDEIADAVERRLSAKLNALSRGAFSDGT